MKSTKTYNLLLLFSMSVITLLVLSLQIQAYSYDLAIEEDDNLIWEISYINEEALQDLIDYEGYSSSYSDLSEGDQYRWEITEVYPERENSYEENYWKVDYTFYYGQNLRYEDAETSEDYEYKIAAEPESLVDDWFNREEFEFGIVLLPDNTDYYLQEFYDNMPWDNKTVYSVSEYKLIENRSSIGHQDKVIITYNNEGIQQNYSLYYGEDLAYQYLLEEKYGNEGFFSPFLIIGITFAVIVVLVIVFALVAIGRKSSKKNYDTNKYANPYRANDTSKSSTESQAPPQSVRDNSQNIQQIEESDIEQEKPKVIGYCTLCGGKQESDAEFCPYCGNRFKN